MALNANVGTAWISVVADTTKIAPNIKKAMGDAEKSISGAGLGKKLASGLGKTLKVGVASVGVAAGGILATSLTKGMGRLQSLENAQAKLRGLGNDAESVTAIMDNALASVKGTSFGMGEAATTAAGAVAAGIKPGEQLENVLKAVANSASATGRGMDEMGGIFNKVASSGKAQNDVLRQVADSGLPIYQTLADQFGVTSDEVTKMASKGKIDFEDFEKAMKSAAGTVADEMGTTTQGTLENLGSAMGRFGEKLQAPIFEAAPGLLGAFTDVFDEMTDAVGPVAESIGESLTPKLEAFATLISDKFAPALGDAVEWAGKWVEKGVDFVLDPESWTHIVDIFGKVRDTVSEMWPSIESLAGSFLTISQSVSVATWEALTSTLDALAPLVESVLVPLLEKVATFAEENPETVEKMVWAFLAFKGVGAISGPVGKAAKTLGNLGGAVSGISKAFKGATFGQGLLTLMGGAKSANPILAKLGKVIGSVFKVFWKLMPILTKVGKVFMTVIRFVNPWVAGISLVVGALTWFFTQTETGQAIVETVFAAIKDAWNWVVDAISSGWENYIKPALDALWQVAQTTLAVIGTVILAPLLIAWNLLSAGIKAAWEKIIKPVWDALSSAISTLWDKYARPIFSAISFAWDVMSSALSATWRVIKTAVFDAWNKYVNKVKENWDLVTSLLSAAWQVVSNRFTAIWDWIRDNVFQPMMDKISELWNAYASPIFQWVGDKWDWLRDAFGAGWNWIRDNVFDAMRKGLDTLKGWFEKGVEGIAKVWEGLKAAAAKPARFVIDTVWNNGILAAWNMISEFLPGIDAKDEIPLGDLGGYASGGVLPGYTPGRDVHEFYSPTGGRIHLSGGEAIMRPEWTRAVGGPGAVERMNRAARSGRLDPNQMRTGNEHAFANGGVWDLGGFANGGVLITTAVQTAMRDIVKSKYPGISLTSATRPGHSGYHGTGHATDWSNGTSNTPMQLALAHDIAQTYPGSAQLIYAAPGWSSNIYEGSPAGAMDSGVYKTAQAGRHDNHVHWAMTTPPTMQFGGGVFEGGSNGGGVGAAVLNWVADQARAIWARVVDPIKDKIGGKAGDWGDSGFAEMPGAMFTSLVDAAWSRLTSLFGSGGGSNSGSVDTSNVPADLVGAVETVFARHGFTGAEWEAAKWIIQQESSWSPTAVNPSSGAYGLFQFNPMGGNTLGAYLPDRNTDPAVQADAGARYMKDRYGTPSAAKAFWEQNHWYAKGGVIPSSFGVFDTGGVLPAGGAAVNKSGKPEVVINNAQLTAFSRLANNVGALVRKLSEDRDAEAFAKALSAEIEPVLKAISNPATDEGIIARGITSRVLDMDILKYSGAMKTIMAAETQFINARESHAGRIQGIADKETALAEAREHLAELAESEGEMSVANQRKLADAQKRLDKARADSAKAEGDKQAAAADKVADAEEKLRRVREDIAASAESDAEKHDEEIKKATEQVTKAEQDLTKARQESVKALDMPLYDVFPQIFDGLNAAAGSVAGLGSQAAAMGGVASQAAPLLAGFSTQLAGVASMAGPAGMAVGVALSAVESILSVVRQVWDVANEINDFFNSFHVHANQLKVQSMGAIREWMALVDDQRQKVSELQTRMVADQIALVAANWKVRTSQADVVRAQLEGVKSVADAEAQLEAERKRVQANALLDYSDLSLAYDRYRWAQRVGMDELVGDVVAVTPELLALQHEVHAARMNAEASYRQAAWDSLEAVWAQEDAARALLTTQENLEKNMVKLAEMGETTFGFTTKEATVLEKVLEYSQKNAELMGERDSLGSRFRGFFGGAGKMLGWDNAWSKEQEGYASNIRANNELIDELLKLTDIDFSDSAMKEFDRAINQAAEQYAAGRKEAGDAIIAGSEIGKALLAADLVDTKNRLDEIDQREDDIKNAIEQGERDKDRETERQKYREEIAALREGGASHQYYADAQRETSEATKEALRALGDWSAANAEAIKNREPVNISLSMPYKESYSRDEMDLVIDAFSEIDEINLRVERLEEPAKPGARELIDSRRRK